MLLIRGMRLARVWQLIYVVKFTLAERHRWRICNEKTLFMRLYEASAAYGVLLSIDCVKCLRVLLFVPLNIIVGAYELIIVNALERRRHIAGACNVCYFIYAHACGKRVRDFDDGAFAHAVYENVCAAVRQYAVAHGIIPIVIMCETS